jgi:UDP-GlcNAc:undecaprenyl-phosphate GlcNAc-1-phosphate transferase
MWWMLLLVMVLNGVGIQLYLGLARRKALLDLPNDRSSHQIPTPRGGGLLWAPTFMAAILLWFPAFYLSALALLLAAGISYIDDLKALPMRYRLPIHFLAVFLLIWDTQAAWPWWAVLAALVLLTGWLNTVNFMDGINGITTVYGLVMLGTFWSLSGTEHPAWSLQALEPIMIMALLAFAVFNFRKKALCFAGDVGSVSLALILGWVFLQHWSGASSLFLLAFPLVYAVDSVMTILVRLSRGENIFQPHRTHLYQLLANEQGWDHRVVALVYGLLQMVINVVAITYLAKLGPSVQLYSLIILYLLFCGLYFGVRRAVACNAELEFRAPAMLRH